MPTDDDIRDNQIKRHAIGYAANPYCKKCHGFGVLYPQDQYGQIDYTQTVRCSETGCLDDAFNTYKTTGHYLELRGISSRQQTFDQFIPKAGTEKTLELFRNLAFNDKAKPFLICSGHNGCGKTHLCQALTFALIGRGIDAHYYRVPDILKELRDSMSDHSTDKLIEYLSTVPALIMDDYGMELQTDWALSNIEDIVDARWQEKRITALTTNKSISDFPARLQSRFGDREISVFILNNGTDYRKITR